MSESIEEILRGAGLTNRPDEYGDGIHGWRCEHPDRYGRCECFAELVDALAEHDRQVAERAWDEAIRRQQAYVGVGNRNPHNPYRAAKGEQK